jgi:cytoskeleton protein RodZ
MTEPTAGQPHAPGPGAELSRERERQGLSEHQVAEQLNLDVNVIRWIENDEFAALGAPVFAKGHLRRYSTLLGLPPERLLAAYEQAEGQPSQPTLIPKAREGMVPVRPPSRWPWVLGGTLAFLLGALLVAWLVENGFRLPGPEPATQPQAIVPGTSPAEAPARATGPPAAEPASVTSSLPSTSTPPGPAESTAPAVGQVSLQFRFSDDTWVEVYDGSGKAVLYDLGSRGTERSLTATAPLSVTVGTPSSVSVFANGKLLALPAAPAGQSLTRFSIGADGVVR